MPRTEPPCARQIHDQAPGRAAEGTQSLALGRDHQIIEPVHLMQALLDQQGGTVRPLLDKCGANINTLRAQLREALDRLPKVEGTGGEVHLSNDLGRLLNLTDKIAQKRGDQYITSELFVLAAIEDRGPARRILKDAGVQKAAIERAIDEIRGGGKVDDPNVEEQRGALEKYTIDLTERAEQGKLDPVIGRDDEIRRTIQVLQRRTKNNPVLIGERRRQDGDRRGPGAAYRQQGSAELHTVVGAGKAEGSMDAGNMLKPALARGELHCVGATTLDEYRKYVEKDTALERRFQKVLVNEPSVEDTIAILRGLKERYEVHHGVEITDPAIVAAAMLSHRYIADRRAARQGDRPDRRGRVAHPHGDRFEAGVNRPARPSHHPAQDRARGAAQGKRRRVEEAARVRAAVRQDSGAREAPEVGAGKRDQGADARPQQGDRGGNRRGRLEVDDGIPVSKMLEGEREKLLRMEDALAKRVVGQDEAVKAVSDAIRRSRAGLSDPNRPNGSFLFLGPTGVGKTELCKALAEFLFDTEEAMVRIDMSEFMEKHSVARLIGAPPGYVGYEEGGYLTEAVRRRPYAVILLDEVEKAHPDVFNVLLQVLDDGRLTDGQGRTVDFRNSVVIMTSNLGSNVIQEMAGEANYARMKSAVMEIVGQHFRPEFINRVDEVVVFHPLGRDQIREIVDIQLGTLRRRLADRDLGLELDDAARDLLGEAGFDPVYGARPLKRAIQHQLENPLAQRILRGEFVPGDTIRVTAKDGELAFERIAVPV